MCGSRSASQAASAYACVAATYCVRWSTAASSRTCRKKIAANSGGSDSHLPENAASVPSASRSARVSAERSPVVSYRRTYAAIGLPWL